MRRVIVSAPPLGRSIKLRKEHWLIQEGIPHARRISWSPQTTPKKTGIFAKLSRSNFFDRKPLSMSKEPYFQEEIEAHRQHHRQDIYIYKYNVSPTNFSLRP